jgi:putative addiction module component (TIGR02574 family)
LRRPKERCSDLAILGQLNFPLDRLGVEERIALVEEIWDSIAADSAVVPLTTPQRDELDRRLADHASHPNDVVPWEEVKASLDERLKK